MLPNQLSSSSSYIESIAYKLYRIILYSKINIIENFYQNQTSMNCYLVEIIANNLFVSIFQEILIDIRRYSIPFLLSKMKLVHYT